MKRNLGIRTGMAVAICALIVSAVATTAKPGAGRSEPISSVAAGLVNGSGKKCVNWCTGPTTCNYVALSDDYLMQQYNPMTACITVVQESVCVIDSTLPCRKAWICEGRNAQGECTDCTRTTALDELEDHCVS